MKRAPQQKQKGFTLVEMLVVAPIVILAIGAFLTAIIAMTGEVLASRASNNLSYNVQDALNRIEQDVKLSNNYLATNSVLGDKQGYDDNAAPFTNIADSNGPSLILNMIATTTNPVSSNSSYVYLKDKPNPCSSAQGNIPFTYNVVYFIKDSVLYRRTIMPSNYNDTNNVCATPWQQPSCSPTYMDSSAGQSGTSFCQTRDVQLVDGVAASDFIVQYFNGESTTTVNTPASSAPSISDRQTALQSATTIGVSITAKQTAAGRDIERAATLRASRLDSNASSIGVVQADTTPSAPEVSATLGEPTTVTFKWPKASNVTGYTFEYQINGGAWTVGFTNQPTQSFTITSTTHKDVVNARVTAINGSLSSGYGTATATIPLWTSLALQNTWVDYGTPYASPGYTKTSAGMIVLKGLVKSGSGIVGYLPAGYRPAKNLMFENYSNGAGGRLDIGADGAIIMSVGSNAWFALDGIAFMPSSTTFTAITAFSNGWVNYSPSSGDPNWQTAGYTLDSAGRVQTTGLVRAGSTPDNTVMFNLPAAYRPLQYSHVLNDINNTGSAIGVDTNGNVVAKGYNGNTYSSLQNTFYPASRATGTNCIIQWCDMTLQNSWTFWGGNFSTPQYTKSTDGLVMLKGLIKPSGSTTPQIATLPAGFCPADKQIIAIASSTTASRLDVNRNTNGTCDLVPSGGTTGWTSLDNAHFIAEP